jgi:hypothetical protein
MGLLLRGWNTATAVYEFRPASGSAEYYIDARNFKLDFSEIKNVLSSDTNPSKKTLSLPVLVRFAAIASRPLIP